MVKKVTISISVDSDVINDFKTTNLNRSKFLEDCMRKKFLEIKEGVN